MQSYLCIKSIFCIWNLLTSSIDMSLLEINQSDRWTNTSYILGPKFNFPPIAALWNAIQQTKKLWPNVMKLRTTLLKPIFEGTSILLENILFNIFGGNFSDWQQVKSLIWLKFDIIIYKEDLHAVVTRNITREKIKKKARTATVLQHIDISITSCTRFQQESSLLTFTISHILGKHPFPCKTTRQEISQL